jgi:hypothetical protein
MTVYGGREIARRSGTGRTSVYRLLGQQAGDGAEGAAGEAEAAGRPSLSCRPRSQKYQPNQGQCQPASSMSHDMVNEPLTDRQRNAGKRRCGMAARGGRRRNVFLARRLPAVSNPCDPGAGRLEGGGAPVTKASKSSYRGHQRSRNGSSALRGFRKLSLNMPRHPLRSVVWDTGFVTVPRRGWPPNPAVTYPDVSGTSNKFKSFGFASRSLLVAAQGRDWRCVNFWKLWLPPPALRSAAVVAMAVLRLGTPGYVTVTNRGNTRLWHFVTVTTG